MRQRIVAANWKMNGSRDFARQLVGQLKSDLATLDNGAEVVIIPPALLVPVVADMLQGSDLRVGVQNVAPWSEGAYTGETSASMASDAGAAYVLCGHSERRQLFAETDQVVAAKVRQILDNGLKPVLCVGETLEQRQAGAANTVVAAQVRTALSASEQSDWGRVVVAYEPVWAIGTGQTASSEDAQAVHRVIRETLAEMGAPAEAMSILYGGSVKAESAENLFKQPDIDGGLIGGASLDAEAFAAICRAF